jgi:hypothetical protein
MWEVWPYKSTVNLHKCYIIDNEPLTGLAKRANVMATFCCLDYSAIVKT